MYIYIISLEMFFLSISHLGMNWSYTSYSTDIHPSPPSNRIHERHLSVDESDDQVAALAFDPLDKTLVSLGGSRWSAVESSCSIVVRFSGREGVIGEVVKETTAAFGVWRLMKTFLGILASSQHVFLDVHA